MEKPYKCDVCTKRYKNLNGLKYVCIIYSFSLTLVHTTTHTLSTNIVY